MLPEPKSTMLACFWSATHKAAVVAWPTDGLHCKRCASKPQGTLMPPRSCFRPLETTSTKWVKSPSRSSWDSIGYRQRPSIVLFSPAMKEHCGWRARSFIASMTWMLSRFAGAPRHPTRTSSRCGFGTLSNGAWSDRRQPAKPSSWSIFCSRKMPCRLGNRTR